MIGLMQKQYRKKQGVSLSQVYVYLKMNPPPFAVYEFTDKKRMTRRRDLNAWLEKIKRSPKISEQEVAN
jgi:hypothetical protein